MESTLMTLMRVKTQVFRSNGKESILGTGSICDDDEQIARISFLSQAILRGNIPGYFQKHLVDEPATTSEGDTRKTLFIENLSLLKKGLFKKESCIQIRC
ncbi:hypothetical protein PHMEG_00018256 [Phytophthora megakarya]|uniref:Uncharacterized protein n=1 Tax=Phytophthora megakarya TaxID=4795 RepID=A0A225VVA4_9STRA|nr:hypothetical protein PHMEG_00018256 [Phytophthora megakarya]